MIYYSKINESEVNIMILAVKELTKEEVMSRLNKLFSEDETQQIIDTATKETTWSDGHIVVVKKDDNFVVVASETYDELIK